MEAVAIDKHRRRVQWQLTPGDPIGEPVEIPDNLETAFVQCTGGDCRVTIELSADGQNFQAGGFGGQMVVRQPVPHAGMFDPWGLYLRPCLTDGDGTVTCTIIFWERG